MAVTATTIADHITAIGLIIMHRGTTGPDTTIATTDLVAFVSPKAFWGSIALNCLDAVVKVRWHLARLAAFVIRCAALLHQGGTKDALRHCVKMGNVGSTLREVRPPDAVGDAHLGPANARIREDFEPSLVKAIIEGRLPRGIGMVRLSTVPAEWRKQHAHLGTVHQTSPALRIRRDG